MLDVPRGRRVPVELGRLAPSGRSLAVGFALLAVGVASYGIARETSVFAVREIEVVGAPPDVRQRVREALAPLVGASLVGLRASAVDRRVAGLPDVVGVTYDRAFPHTLRVHVLPERPVIVLRRGAESWLVSARGRVVRPLDRGARPELPRVWVPRTVDVAAGETLADPAAGRAVAAAVLAAKGLDARVRAVKVERAETTLVLRSGVEVRLGRDHDLPLKLAVAGRVLEAAGAAATYVDVAVPDRPVSDGGTQAQVELEG